MAQKNEMSELIEETIRRQRIKTDLSAFSSKLKEMMDLNISLPVQLGWLEKQGKKTTLPALRRFVNREFGEEKYEAFMRRNGWIKTKKVQAISPKAPAAPGSGKLDGGEPEQAPAAPDLLGEGTPVSTKHGADSGKSVATIDALKEANNAVFDPNDYLK